MRVEPLLQIRLCPRGVKLKRKSALRITDNNTRIWSTHPVSGIGGSLPKLLSDGVVACTGLAEDGITLAWLRNRNAVVVAESLQLRLGP